jgi:hypothetical protein
MYHTSGHIELTEVLNNKIQNLDSTIGKSYTLKNNLSLTTDTNGVSSYIFPHRIAISQKESTSLYFTQDDVKYANTFVLPEVVKITESSFTVSVNGTVYIVSESDKQSVVGTSMSNILFNRAKLFINSSDKYTQIYVQSGECVVQDIKSSKKKKELKAGDFLVITPQISLSPREGSLRSAGNSFSVKEVDEDEVGIYNVEIQQLQEKLDNTVFVNYNENIFGFKLR